MLKLSELKIVDSIYFLFFYYSYFIFYLFFIFELKIRS